jgi:hypothetical protein
MFRTDSPASQAADFLPVDGDAILDDEFLDPTADDYLDRCLFEMRQSLADYRIL